MRPAPLLSADARSASSRRKPQIGWTQHHASPQPDRTPRRLAIYDARSGFDMVEELEHLCNRTIEPNIFFSPPFLAPAMPRVEDRDVLLAVIRDGKEDNDRVRLVLPFTVQPSPTGIGPSIMRTWAHAFGLLGTPLVDRDDPAAVLDDFLGMARRARLKLPSVMVLPNIRLDGPFAGLLRTVADHRSLPWHVIGREQRPILNSHLSGDDYLKQSLRPHHAREYRRLRRRLEEQGTLQHCVARSPVEVRRAMEDFLALEAAGWKGKRRTALAIDRLVAAFAREAVQNLAERDMTRVHTLTLNGKVVAALIVFVEGGTAYTWKTTFDENFSAFSPGTLLMIEVTKQHLPDPNIEITDSCAIPNHPVMSRLWTERQVMGTIVMGLTPKAERAAKRVSTELHLYGETREVARKVRKRISKVTG
ncbi:MAG: GNAT family N-acetyltransferase [Rhizobiaceae bacterium]|nr:GNAT family N-acetyltransferase [Rhizobiaceae bacterium]